MTLLIVNVCAFANQTAKLPQHVGAMSWHQAKFHYFHACFGFTETKKTKFLNVSSPGMAPRILNFIPISWKGPRNLPRGHTCDFFNQLWYTGACACFKLNYAHKGDTFPLRTTSLLERSSDLQEAYTKICSYSPNFFYHSMVVPWHDTMPSFMIFRRVLDLQEF